MICMLPYLFFTLAVITWLQYTSTGDTKHVIAALEQTLKPLDKTTWSLRQGAK